MGLLDSLVADHIEQCDIFALLYINDDIYVKIEDRGVYGPYSSVELQVPGVLYVSAYNEIEHSNQGGVLTAKGLEVLTSNKDILKGKLVDAIKTGIDNNEDYKEALRIDKEESYRGTSVLTISPRNCDKQEKSKETMRICHNYLDIIVGDILDFRSCLGIWDKIHKCWVSELSVENRYRSGCAKELNQHAGHE